MNHLDQLAADYGTERRDGETDQELHTRLLCRFTRFRRGSVWDIVHSCEQTIHRESPITIDQGFIRRNVAFGLLSRNKSGKLYKRLICAFKAFWSCL